MKVVEWMRFFATQREQYDKKIFTVAELANVASSSPAVMNVELGRLVKQGLIRRWVPGRYGLPDGVTAAELATAIDADAYVTGAYALASHGFITQVPHEIDCFTRRRRTPLGSLVFVCVSPGIHRRPESGGSATAEQALCDLLYVLRRRGLDPRSLYTFRNLDRLSIPPTLLARYPLTVQRAARSLLGSP